MLQRLSDRSVITVETYPGGSFSGESRYSYLLRRNEVIITQGGAHKGAAKWVKDQWVRERTSYSVTDQDMAVLRREAPNGPSDVRRVLEEGPDFRMRENPQRKKVEIWFRAGAIERGSNYAWRDGYSQLTPSGMTYPWLTKREAQAQSKRRGARALFFDTREDAEKAMRDQNLAPNPMSKRCQKITSRTIREERRKGVPQDQAVAIGLSKARAAGCRVPPPPRALEENPTSFWKKYSV